MQRPALFEPKRKKTPVILQMEAVECGAAALAIVLGYYGRFVPLSELRAECGVSRDGSKASNLLKAARRQGMKAKGYSKGLEKVTSVHCPFIVFWEFNHFVVVEGFHKGKVYLNDPAMGHRTLTFKEFDEGFTGVVLAMEPGPEFRSEGSLPSPLPAIWERMRGSRTALIYVAILGLLAVAPGVAQATFMRVFIDSVFVGGRSDWLRPLLVAMVGVLAISLLLAGVSNLFFRRLRLGLSAKLNAEFYRHLLRLPYKFYAQRYAGEVVNRSGLNDSLVGLIAGQLTGSAIGLVSMVLFGIVLFSYSFSLTMIGVTSALVNFAVLRWVSKTRVEANMRVAKEVGKVQGVTIAGLQSMEDIKGGGMEDTFFNRWAGMFTASSNSTQSLALASMKFSVLPTFANSIVSALTLVVGGLQIMNGHMTFGTLLAFQSLMGRFLGPMNSLLNLGMQLQQIRGNVIRLEDVMSTPTRDEELAHLRESGEDDPKTVPPSEWGRVARLDGRVECRGLTFGYSPLEPPLIPDFNLVIKTGQRIALVGGTGSGKSTIARLIAGLLQPWSGKVLLDGHPLSAVPREVLASSLAMVEQDILLFEGTVRDNLSLWDDTLPIDRIIEACEDAAILDDVMALPGGLEASLQENGINLSGGQRQRLEIARALARQPSFLILDEATSALDAETEAIVDGNLRRRGCTCLIVSHRLSTIRDCDEIIVLDKGVVAERGHHRELWAADGLYASLLRSHDAVSEEP